MSFTTPSDPVFGDDNINGDLIISVGDLIHGNVAGHTNEQHQYTVEGLLGCGSFAQVILAAPLCKGASVAVKVIKAVPECAQQSRIEIAMMAKLQKVYGSGNRGIVAMLGQFTFKSHLCIVFERLGSSLLDVLASGGYRGLSLRSCATLAAEILDAIQAMAKVGIIHCDLKPENILLKGNSVEDGIKVVDFGSACIETNQHFQTYFQSRFYRAPEVIMAADYTRAVDMWSFGCIIAELALGKPVFSGGSEFDHLHQIDTLVGPFPPQMLARSRKMMDYYEISGTPSHGSTFTLKEYEAFSKEKGVKHKAWKGAPQRWPGVVRRLRDVTTVLVQKSNEPSDEAEVFAEFLIGCLTIDPATRFDAGTALKHNFILYGSSTEESNGLAVPAAAAVVAAVAAVAAGVGGVGEGSGGGGGGGGIADEEATALASPSIFQSLSLLLQSPPRVGYHKMRSSPILDGDGDDRESPLEQQPPDDDIFPIEI